MRWPVLILSVTLMFPGLARAASFSCSGPLTDIEHLICNTPNLSEADSSLSNTYRTAFSKLSEDGKLHLRANERYWLQSSRAYCKNSGRVAEDAMSPQTEAECLLQQYEERTSSLRNEVRKLGPYVFYPVDASHQTPDGIQVFETYPQIDSRAKLTTYWNTMIAQRLTPTGDDLTYAADHGKTVWRS